MSTQPDIRPFDRLNASDAQYASYNHLANAIRKEAMPDDPATPVEQTKLELQNVPPIIDIHLWTADVDGEIVGSADLGIPRLQTNNHVVQFEVRVLPEYRRRGLGTRFLKQITDVTVGEKRSLMISSTRSTIPAGEKFMHALQANVGLATHINEVRIENLNRDLLRQWQDRAAERAQGFEIGVWEGRYPESELEAITEMKQLINTMPTDTLEIEDFEWTPDEVRHLDDSAAAQGDQRWTIFVRERSTGKLAGYTELSWNPAKQEHAQQLDTAVHEIYKNRGLGRWLKAAMLEKLLRERPEVKTVRTGNAQSNAPMLKINTELGFRPSVTQSIWQVATHDVEQYLAGRLEAVPS